MAEAAAMPAGEAPRVALHSFGLASLSPQLNIVQLVATTGRRSRLQRPPMFDASLFPILVPMLAAGMATGRRSGLVEIGRGFPPLPAFVLFLILAAIKMQRTALF
ncbi:hypothetical protein GCM10011324_26120 [Allosediminivita pacifica]|nr:hypothetical protein GCM10011324_26120 [Allosediminivita pacifica]